VAPRQHCPLLPEKDAFSERVSVAIRCPEIFRQPPPRNSRRERRPSDGPGWICRVVQRCEHAEGGRSTTTDLTLIRSDSSAGERRLRPKDAGSSLVSGDSAQGCCHRLCHRAWAHGGGDTGQFQARSFSAAADHRAHAPRGPGQPVKTREPSSCPVANPLSSVMALCPWPEAPSKSPVPSTIVKCALTSESQEVTLPWYWNTNLPS